MTREYTDEEKKMLGITDTTTTGTDTVVDTPTATVVTDTAATPPVETPSETVVTDTVSQSMQDPSLPAGAVTEMVPTPPPAPVQEVIQPVAQPKAIDAPVQESPVQAPVVESPVAQVVEYASDLERQVLTTIESYIEAMKPGKPVQTHLGVQWQVRLYRALQMCINQQTTDFSSTFRKILALFDEHKKGVFHEVRVFRFFDEIALPENDRKAFQRLLNLLKVAASVQGRDHALKQVDLNNTLQFGVTHEGRQRILGFFNK